MHFRYPGLNYLTRKARAGAPQVATSFDNSQLNPSSSACRSAASDAPFVIATWIAFTL
jgi:hypothetical protein